MMDVKTLSGVAGLYREGPHARSNWRGAPVAERARKVHVDYVGRARALDHAHTAGRRTARPTLAYASRYSGTSSAPCSRRCRPGTLGPARWSACLVVGSYQGCSEAPSRARWRRTAHAVGSLAASERCLRPTTPTAMCTASVRPPPCK